MFVILPFEKEFYSKFDYKVDFVGHPLLDAVSTIKRDDDFISKFHLDQRPIVAILPGSRKQEIEKMLPVMIAVAKRFDDLQFVIAGAPSMEDGFYKNIISDTSIKLISGRTYQILLHAKAAMVTSGTATLETALFGVPEVVCYKGGNISYQIAKRLVKVNYISLVNLILNKEAVKELIQNNFNENTLFEELNALLYSKERLEKLVNDYKALRDILGGSGASEKAAQLMIGYLKEKLNVRKLQKNTYFIFSSYYVCFFF
jgi:lipid-A-disaccharide synthase